MVTLFGLIIKFHWLPKNVNIYLFIYLYYVFKGICHFTKYIFKTKTD